jgi:hypothetical protein
MITRKKSQKLSKKREVIKWEHYKKQHNLKSKCVLLQYYQTKKNLSNENQQRFQ